MDLNQFPQEDDFLPKDIPPVPTDPDFPEEPELPEPAFLPESEVTADPVPPSQPEVPAEDNVIFPGKPAAEDASVFPEETATEDTPVFPEETATEDTPVFPEETATENTSVFPEEPAVEVIPLFPEAPFSSETEAPETAHPSFIERIPDVEDTPEEEAPPFHSGALEVPDLQAPLTPDEDALNFHGMLRHGEEEPPFDPSILHDPALAEDPLFSEIPEETETLEMSADTEEVSASQEYRDSGKAPDPATEAPAAQHEVPPHTRPVRKGRPKRKKGEGLLGIPNILTTVVWLALILAIGVTAGRMLWVCAADVLAFGRENKPVTITIYEADDMASITDKLYNAGLIRYKSLFNLYASISDAEEKIKPGIYDLNTLYDYHALVNFMTPRSSREVIALTIPEGYTCRQIFDLLEENRVCTAVDAASYAATGELKDYWFLEGVPRGDKYCLEGFLFPDTYEFYKNSTPREALERMLNNFEKRFSEEMRAQIDDLNENVTDGTFTVREVTIVASLIEKESAAPSESPSIAGVIYNRLFRWDGTPAYLNIDASIIYAQDGNAETIDTHLDSPYNTYTHTGLTPTPISNPGLASLQAALSPESHNYYYYVLNPTSGMHQFASTQEEHNANIAAFYG